MNHENALPSSEDSTSSTLLRQVKALDSDAWQRLVRLALSSGDEPVIRLWDLESDRQVGTLKGHKRYVFSATFTADGRRVLSGSRDGTIRLWDLASRTEVYRVDGESGMVLSVAVSPDGRLALSGSQGPTLITKGEDKRILFVVRSWRLPD